MKRLVLKDFLALKEGDIISLTSNGYNTFYVSVDNREIDVPFYGNDKGRWGKDNPSPRSGNNPVTDYKPNVHFMWVKEKIVPFTAMEFKMPPCPRDLTKHITYMYSGDEWMQICRDKIISDLESQGVI